MIANNVSLPEIIGLEIAGDTLACARTFGKAKQRTRQDEHALGNNPHASRRSSILRENQSSKNLPGALVHAATPCLPDELDHFVSRHEFVPIRAFANCRANMPTDPLPGCRKCLSTFVVDNTVHNCISHGISGLPVTVFSARTKNGQLLII